MAKTINQFQRESRMDCYAENEQLRAENAALAAALVTKDAALQRCTKFTQEDYDALTLQPCPEVLNKVRAEAVREAAEDIEFGPITCVRAKIVDRLNTFAQRIEQGEAG